MDPMPGSRAAQRELVDLCESGFVRDVFERLIGLGYKVTPQVGVGGYHIDLVVEGDEGRRLAIELDGDQFHPPEQWADDFRRQRVLERVGWTFWSCWGSSFAMDPEACMGDLLRILDEMRIDPIGGTTGKSRWTEHRVLGEVDSSVPAVLRGDDADSSVEKSVGAVTSLDSEISESGSLDLEAPEGALSQESLDDELYVQVGDKVQVLFQDEPDRKVTVMISAQGHDPGNFVIHHSRPLAVALLGHAVDEEVEVQLDAGGVRTAVIVRIEKGGSEPRRVA
jgi:very-short-patch-repair endonuclease